MTDGTRVWCEEYQEPALIYNVAGRCECSICMDHYKEFNPETHKAVDDE